MKNKLTLSIILLSCSSSAFAMTEDEIAQEVAYCYAAHKNAQTEFYLNNSTDKYLELIDNLVGNDEARKKLNLADNKIKGNNLYSSYDFASRVGRPNFDKAYAKKYCSSIDQKLIKLQNT